MDNLDVDINLETESPNAEGETQIRKLQSNNRVNLPSRFCKHLGIGEGEEVLLIAKENSIEIFDSDVDIIDI